MALHTFEELEVWKRACRLSVDVCDAAKTIKPYALQDQISRAAISIPSNIAEGAERDSEGDFIRFLRIAKGSCAELRTQLYIYRKLSERSGETLEGIASFIEETRGISAMLQALIFKIQKN